MLFPTRPLVLSIFLSAKNRRRMGEFCFYRSGTVHDNINGFVEEFRTLLHKDSDLSRQ